ncbi:MAG TPA: tripartite tricarboxylate transporter TctB family protein [Xanthobacteraceae bacterium]|nr:tripartite tricarboxylate transporter TctB family protein [Xanthobacteraceae bacterium]
MNRCLKSAGFQWGDLIKAKGTPLRRALLFLKHKRDFYAGGMLILIGLGAAIEAYSYNVGTLMHMGPGFLPVALGILLILLGIMIAGPAVASPIDENERFLPATLQWRGWGCIIAGPLLFIVLGEYGGLIPATFACVFVSALGDRTATLKSSFVLAAGVTFFGVLLFTYVLGVPFPILRWGSTHWGPF